jgi:biotin operon repressor
MRQAGASRAAIAAELGVSRAQLTPIIAQKAIRMRWRNGSRATTGAERAKMIALRQEGKTLQQIGEELGRSRQVVAYWMTRLLGAGRNDRAPAVIQKIEWTDYLFVPCENCAREIGLPPWRKASKRHFCDTNCYRGWQKKQAVLRAARQADG